MGGGKSRAMCEAIFDLSLDHPGLISVIARDTHTSIITSTKKTMVDQVCPPGDQVVVARKASQGEDWIRFFNGSQVHFIGMDDPYRWYSSEIGVYALDEAQEIPNVDAEKVIRLLTRCRQRCDTCIRTGNPDCEHMPHLGMLSFNPSSPGHWLREWFILGAEQTEFGYRKPEFRFPGADEPYGSADFFFALPTDNPYLSQGYLKDLRGLPGHLRRRYLEGKWEYLSDSTFFDIDALEHYENVARDTRVVMQGATDGDIEEDARWRGEGRRGNRMSPVRFREGHGPLHIWKRPVPEHRYVMAIDVSSGGSYDYSAIQVVDVEEFEQAAEWQGKIDPDLVAAEAYRIGRLYNDAIAVPELTGGWGVTIDQELKRLRYPKGRLYTRRIRDRLTNKWTDRTGWDTNTKTRFHMLDTLERVLREQDFGLYSLRTVAELGDFVWTERKSGYGRPEAREGCNDDLVMALAIGVTVATQLPRELRRQKPAPRNPLQKQWRRAADARRQYAA